MFAAADQNPSSSRRGPGPADTGGAGGGATTRFRERLLPGVGAWIVVVVIGATLGVVLVPLSQVLALVVGVAAAVLACVIAYATSPVLEVAGGRFTMGRARIEVELLGRPEVLQGEDWYRTMHTGFEPLAHHCTRGWIHSGVRVAVNDPEDPVTAWVASSRRPEDLALALRSAQQAADPRDG